MCSFKISSYADDHYANHLLLLKDIHKVSLPTNSQRQSLMDDSFQHIPTAVAVYNFTVLRAAQALEQIVNERVENFKDRQAYKRHLASQHGGEHRHERCLFLRQLVFGNRFETLQYLRDKHVAVLWL